jgi:hypothetical protein
LKTGLIGHCEAGPAGWCATAALGFAAKRDVVAWPSSTVYLDLVQARRYRGPAVGVVVVQPPGIPYRWIGSSGGRAGALLGSLGAWGEIRRCGDGQQQGD